MTEGTPISIALSTDLFWISRVFPPTCCLFWPEMQAQTPHCSGLPAQSLRSGTAPLHARLSCLWHFWSQLLDKMSLTGVLSDVFLQLDWHYSFLIRTSQRGCCSLLTAPNQCRLALTCLIVSDAKLDYVVKTASVRFIPGEARVKFVCYSLCYILDPQHLIPFICFICFWWGETPPLFCKSDLDAIILRDAWGTWQTFRYFWDSDAT